MSKDEELVHLRQENQALQAANQTLRECVLESIQAIEALHKQVKELQGVISSQQDRIKTLEARLAKDSHNSNLPPSSDRFVRPAKSLRQPSGKKPGGQKGHRGHHLRQVENPRSACSKSRTARAPPGHRFACQAALGRRASS